MSHSRNKASLGAVLQQAGLVSAEQVNQALKQQEQTHRNLSIGEILAAEGKIDPKTVDFFAKRWCDIVVEKRKQPIGQYLKQAALIDEQQIQVILNEQQTSQLKFGELAIAKGWLKPVTIDFFLHHLKADVTSTTVASLDEIEGKPAVSTIPIQPSKYSTNSSDDYREQDYSQKVHEGFLQIKRKLFKLEEENAYSERTIERVLFWTNGHSLLTQKVFSLIAQSNISFSTQQEEEQIDYLVQTKIISNWTSNELKSHLKSVRNRLLYNQHCPPDRLLHLYQKTLTETVPADNSEIQQELFNLGLVVKQQDKLVVANRIYRAVFNLSWVVKALKVRAKLSKNSDAPSQEERSSATVNAPSAVAETRDSWLNLKNILLLLTFIGLLSIFVSNIAKRIMVRTAFQAGNELLKQKSYSEAIKEYNKLLKQDSNYFQAWTNRGYALAGLQKYEAMRESCAAATIIDPTAVYAWNCQGEALHNLQRDTEAIVAFDKAISLNPADPIFLINKSESLSALGDSEGSIESIQQAIAVLEKIEAIKGIESIRGEYAVALTFLGNSYRQRKEYDAAITAYERALNYAPKYFPARVGKGITLSRAQQQEKAQAEFRRILADPQLTTTQQAQTWFYLGKTLCKSQQNAEGIAAFESAIAIKPDYEIANSAKEQCN